MAYMAHKRLDVDELSDDERDILYKLYLATPPMEEGPMEAMAAQSDEDAIGAVLAGHYHGNMRRLAQELVWNRESRRAAERREMLTRTYARKLADVVTWLYENPKDKRRKTVLAAAMDLLDREVIT